MNTSLGQGQADHSHNGEDIAQRAGLEEFADVVGSAAAVLVIDLFLEQLCHGALDEGSCCAQNGHHPHPEQSAGAAIEDGGGHAGDIAGTHTAGNGHAECLEGGKAALGFLSVEKQTCHVAQVSHLYAAQGDGEDQAATQAQIDQGHCPDVAIEGIRKVS